MNFLGVLKFNLLCNRFCFKKEKAAMPLFLFRLLV